MLEYLNCEPVQIQRLVVHQRDDLPRRHLACHELAVFRGRGVIGDARCVREQVLDRDRLAALSRSATYFVIGSSNRTFPCCTSCKTATAVNCLVIDPMRKIRSAQLRAGFNVGQAVALGQDGLAVENDQRDKPGLVGVRVQFRDDRIKPRGRSVGAVVWAVVGTARSEQSISPTTIAPRISRIIPGSPASGPCFETKSLRSRLRIGRSFISGVLVVRKVQATAGGRHRQ